MPGRHSTEQSWRLRDEALAIIPMATQTHSKAARESLRGVEPCYIARGQGCRVWDLDGNEYIDFRNGLGPVSLGHRFPAVEDAIRRQLENGILFGYPSPLEVEVAQQLVEVIPCAESVRFLKTGGEAMAAAIHLARAFTGRDLVLKCGYHGWLQASSGPGVPEAVAATYRDLPWGNPQPYEDAFAREGGRIAAVSVACAYADAEKGRAFYPALRDLTRRHGALLIHDEIVMGFRLAVAGAQEYFGVTPDLAVFAKGISNGAPLACYLGRRDVMESVRRAVISSTFGGDTLSLAAAKAAIGVYRNEDVIGHLWARGRQLHEGMRAAFAEFGAPADVRGLPPCGQLSFRTGDRERDGKLLLRFEAEILRRGVMIYRVMYPNYSHSEADVDEALGRMRAALGAMREDGLFE
ncbi:MAG: aminotransferase class III-fold pyridoxal phosphate-dependent enzyme [Armatimonadetes bacterium]|nr:aminotransferase class III-fold pyridoxal phosphate-dependent enzyme [Armatimonadota bacterium]